MSGLRERLVAVWRWTLSLSWPIAVEQTFNTLMRTTDILVTGLFSPAAVAAVGLADLYGQLPLRVGMGLGAGAIALSSQDTGRGAEATRDAAITQAVAIGALVGVPLGALGVLFGDLAIRILGASPEVVRMGGAYLALVFAAAPAHIVSIVGARALQGTGDTRTPMYVNVASNAINIALSVGLGLGLAGLPRLGIVGVGVATAIARFFAAAAFLLAIHSEHTVASFARPRDLTVTRQLVAVSVPNLAEGMSTSLGLFPFNALLLTFGTDVNAAYHIGRRVFHQIAGPLYRSYATAASIIVGQTLGQGDPEGARFSGIAMVAFGLVTLGAVASGMFVGADPLARVFTDQPDAVGHAADFVRLFAGIAVLFAFFSPFAGGLRGAGDTRTPFYARLIGTAVFLLAFSYVVGVVLGYGLPGVLAGLFLTHACRAAVVSVGFLRGGWADRASAMMDERAAISD